MNEDNIELLCACCSKQRRHNFQSVFNPSTLRFGMFIKKAFRYRDQVEHMWVKILKINKKSVVGVLDNKPILLKNIKYGDIVKVKFNEIEQAL